MKAEAELFAHDMARLDAMFASHNCRHVYLDAGTNVGVQIRKVLEPARYPLSGAGRSEHQFGSLVFNLTPLLLILPPFLTFY